MEKHMIEIMMEIEEGYIGEEDFADKINEAHQTAIEDAGVIGRYHFWLDHGGFCVGDATDAEIRADIDHLGVSDVGELFRQLNNKFCEVYTEILKEEDDENDQKGNS